MDYSGARAKGMLAPSQIIGEGAGSPGPLFLRLWKEIVTKSFIMPQQSYKIMG